jgi:hypothetical protein
VWVKPFKDQRKDITHDERHMTSSISHTNVKKVTEIVRKACRLTRMIAKVNISSKTQKLIFTKHVNMKKAYIKMALKSLSSKKG